MQVCIATWWDRLETHLLAVSFWLYEISTTSIYWMSNLPTPFLLCVFLCLFLRFSLFSRSFRIKKIRRIQKRRETTFKKHTRNSFRMTSKMFLFIFLIQDMIRCIFMVSYRSKLLKILLCYSLFISQMLHSDFGVMAFCCRTGRK